MSKPQVKENNWTNIAVCLFSRRPPSINAIAADLKRSRCSPQNNIQGWSSGAAPARSTPPCVAEARSRCLASGGCGRRINRQPSHLAASYPPLKSKANALEEMDGALDARLLRTSQLLPEQRTWAMHGEPFGERGKRLVPPKVGREDSPGRPSEPPVALL